MNWGLWLNVVLTLAVVVAGIGWRRARWELRSLWDEFDAMRELAEGNEALVVLAAEKHNETLNRHVTDLMAEIERLKTEPPIPEPKSTPCGLFLPDALKPDEVQRILGQTLPETPWWKLINQVLITETLAAMDKVCDARAADRPGSLAHAAGALETVLALRTNLEADRMDAHRIQEQKERQ